MVGWGVKTNKSKDIGIGYTVGGHHCKKRWSDFINYAKVSLLTLVPALYVLAKLHSRLTLVAKAGLRRQRSEEGGMLSFADTAPQLFKQFYSTESYSPNMLNDQDQFQIFKL